MVDLQRSQSPLPLGRSKISIAQASNPQDSLASLCFKALMQEAPDAIAIFTADGTILDVNRRTEALMKRERSALIGSHISDFAPPGFIDKNNESFAAAKVDGSRIPPVRIQADDGSVIVLQVSMLPISGGAEPMFMSISRDITELTRAQEQLASSERLASLGLLAAGVAHEVNSPLAAIVANLEFVSRAVDSQKNSIELPVARDLNDSLHDAREAAERVRDIVRDLKTFSRKEDTRRVPVDVAQIMESCLRMASCEIRVRARLEKDYARIPMALGDEGLISQVLLNLVVNAAQAIPAGLVDSNKIRVVLKEDPKDWVCIEISDTGPGIPQAVAQKLFTPFFTTKPVGVGTGLGLSICRKIICDLGGSITLQNGPGGGAIARVLLPAHHDRSPKSNAHETLRGKSI